MKTVLVTGAAGFLGGAIVARLRADGMRVRAFVRPGRAAAADERVEGDLRDREALTRAVEGVDAVVHAGARVATTGAWEEFEATNVGATTAIIDAARAAGVRRVVHVSSLSVYAVPNDGAVVREDSAYDDGGGERGFYARSKLLADQAAMAAIAAGAPVTVVRPGLLYGPGQRPPLARRSIAVGPLRLLMARRGYLLPLAYVDNVADAIALAVTSPAAEGRAYTIVDVHAPQADYARLYRQVQGANWVPFYLPLGLLRAGVSGVETLARLAGRRAPISRHQVDRTLRSATFTTRRAHEELGWHPRIALDEALRRSFAAAPTPTQTPA
ncbi:MAG TPA: NAD-dependent epimerase/dehydratase family protein [Candidatus Dormibacteraeota bacterium]|nr:NAD-dependent epimerase/dehydratase family protein [Candidatus Dormibacteraeota bacterium]